MKHSDYYKQNILITWSTGFIWRALIQYLCDTWYLSLFALVRTTRYMPWDDTVISLIGDMNNYESLLNATRNIDIVVHLAAAKSDEKDSYETNVKWAKNLVKACEINWVKKIINITTASVKIKKMWPYASTKNAADEIFIKSKIPTITLRPSIVYWNSDINNAFSKLVTYASRSCIPVIGTWKYTSYPIHVDDVCKTIDIAIQKELPTQTYDVGWPDEVTLNQFIKMIVFHVLKKKRTIVIHLPIIFGLFIYHFFSLLRLKSPMTKSNILWSNQEIKLNVSEYFHDFWFVPRRLSDWLDDIYLLMKNQKEAMLIYNYILPKQYQSPFSNKEIELYTRALHANGVPLANFSSVIYTFPFLLGMLDAVSKIIYPNSKLQKRLLIVSSLIESNPRSADRLLPRKRTFITIFLLSIFLVSKAILKLLWGFLLFLIPWFIKKNVW